MKNYNHIEIERKWQNRWGKDHIYQPNMETAKHHYFNLMMFPYPSAEGLHVGNMYAFTGSDVWGRFMRMRGYDVFEPMGLDGFGIHSENYAIKIKEHISEVSKRTEKHFYEQLHMIGNQFDWSRTVETYKPDYYKWTQWLFVEMFKHGLAYRKKATVNWCPSCKTVLSDEQVEGGVCERCKSETEIREMEQWFWKITDYAERLLKNLEWINWSEEVKIGQKHWIGKSISINIDYKVDKINEKIICFTTRPDTNFGATFIVVAPDSSFVSKNIDNFPNKKEVIQYVKITSKKSEQERISEGRKKTGVFTGLYAINNLNGRRMPIYISDFVLATVGTGAVIGVPGHDKRDFEFAIRFDIPIINVVSLNGEMMGLVERGWSNDFDKFIKDLESINATFFIRTKNKILYTISEDKVEGWVSFVKASVVEGAWHDLVGDYYIAVFSDGSVNRLSKFENDDKGIFDRQRSLESSIKKFKNIWEMLYHSSYTDFVVQEKKGTMVNSEFLNGMDIHKAIEKIMNYIESKRWGKRAVSYKLRDWCISRQRYWGPPIPMIYCKKCGWQSVKKEDLPILLPEIEKLEDILPDGSGRGPLAKVEKFVNTVCPKCKGEAIRETDVSDPFVDSCWYFLRYPSTEFKNVPFDKNRTKKWLPVNMYIGGKEHTVLHLLYSRFVTMALKDWGYIDFEEPYKRFFGHGLLIKEGAKMSKSKGNVINPDEYIERYGADAVRMYLMFLGNFEQGGDWRDIGMKGMYRFIKRIYDVCTKLIEKSESGELEIKNDVSSSIHKCIQGVEIDLERLSFNTAISKLMIFFNGKDNCPDWRCKINSKVEFEKSSIGKAVDIKALEKFLILLVPFTPHLAEELWSKLGNKYSIHRESWPVFDRKMLEEKDVTIAVQINGKLRDTILIQINARQKEVETSALDSSAVKKYIKGKIKKVIYVKNKIINFVV